MKSNESKGSIKILFFFLFCSGLLPVNYSLLIMPVQPWKGARWLSMIPLWWVLKYCLYYKAYNIGEKKSLLCTLDSKRNCIGLTNYQGSIDYFIYYMTNYILFHNHNHIGYFLILLPHLWWMHMLNTFNLILNNAIYFL